MTARLLFLAVLISATLSFAKEPAPNPNSSQDSRESLFSLDKKAAEKKGNADAKSDFEAGTYRLLTYGLPHLPTDAEKDLKKKGITLEAIAGCVVSDGILGYAHGYNSVMLPLLKKKFGADVFKGTNFDQ